MSKLLVIDSSVLHASGDSMHPTSFACREFLEHVRELCHRAAATKQLLAEWSRHQSRYASAWLTSMFARRKLIVLKVDEDAAMRHRLLARRLTVDEVEAIRKDFFLIEAARLADHIVISLDDQARGLFDVDELNTVTWLNPVTRYPECITWLKDGAGRKEEWLLGQRR